MSKTASLANCQMPAAVKEFTDGWGHSDPWCVKRVPVSPPSVAVHGNRVNPNVVEDVWLRYHSSPSIANGRSIPTVGFAKGLKAESHNIGDLDANRANYSNTHVIKVHPMNADAVPFEPACVHSMQLIIETQNQTISTLDSRVNDM